jgi:hypothetical protein
MHGEAAGRPEQQRMIVVAKEGIDGDQAVSPADSDDHRLAPFGLEHGKQPRPMSALAPGRRDNELDGPRRLVLRLGGTDDENARECDCGRRNP